MKSLLHFQRVSLWGPLRLGTDDEIRGTPVSQCYNPSMASQKRPTSKSDMRPAGFVVAREAFEKISAADFDRRGLSAEERRREIISAHRPKG